MLGPFHSIDCKNKYFRQDFKSKTYKIKRLAFSNQISEEKAESILSGNFLDHINNINKRRA